MFHTFQLRVLRDLLRKLGLAVDRKAPSRIIREIESEEQASSVAAKDALP
jgi:hypothetical protein